MTGHARPVLSKRLVAVAVAVAFVLLGACYLFLFRPNPVVTRNGEPWVRSAVSLKNIGQALHSYHEVHGHLPPAVLTGKDGRPLYSWRVALLPYLDEDHLYKQFALDEPWDSPHNRALLKKVPRCYGPALGGNDPPGMTRYLAFVGPGTAFERPGLTWDDFPDGRADTFLAVEAGRPVPWSRPADLAYDPEGPLPLLGGAFTRPIPSLFGEKRAVGSSPASRTVRRVSFGRTRARRPCGPSSPATAAKRSMRPV